MHRFPQSIRDQLHVLASEAYDREVGPLLEALGKHFDAWKEKRISNSDLSDLIHTQHQGALREVFRHYKGLDSDVLVARAVAAKILKENEIPSEIFEVIKNKIELFGND